MDSLPRAFALQARWVFPVVGPPIAHGVVTVADGRIARVGRQSDGPQPIDLGSLALLPGLVNAHTHLEFSDCRKPFGLPGQPFPDWIRQVVQARRARGGDRPTAVRRGLEESVACGVTALGEIATPGWPTDATAGATQDTTIFLEQLGLTSEREAVNLQAAREHLQRARGQTWRAGLSPHAPYTVRLEMVAELAALAAQEGAPLAMHLAESPEELELLATGGGPFNDLLQELGAWQPTAFQTPRTPLDYLHCLATARALVIHGNYLAAAEWDFLAQAADRLTLVFCPRTHAYFGHRRHEFARLLASGGSVALGTDSRASNPDLSMLAEVRHVARHYPEVSPAKALELGTLGGATALGYAESLGSLTAGKQADMVVIQAPDDVGSDPHDVIFANDSPAVGAMKVGRWVMNPSLIPRGNGSTSRPGT